MSTEKSSLKKGKEITLDFVNKVELTLTDLGWGQKWYYSPDYDTTNTYCKFCLMGAAFYVADELDGQYAVTDTKVRWAEFLGFEDEDALYLWNDAPERTKEEVMERIRAAKENLQ